MINLRLKMQMRKLLALLAIAVCLQLSGYATSKNDLRYKPPPFTYWLTYTYEGVLPGYFYEP